MNTSVVLRANALVSFGIVDGLVSQQLFPALLQEMIRSDGLDRPIIWEGASDDE